MGAQAVRLSNVDIDNALKNKDFEVLFQPIFDLGNGALARVETFVRWRHPSLGVLPPGAFISFFESQGRMSELTRYVLQQALTEYLEWRGPYAPGFSINLALSDLADGAFASHFKVLTRELGFPAELVTLECPMPPVDMDAKTAAEHFQRLSETGARLAIEVRGRANDFLRNIDPFPFVEIKTGGAAILRFARTVRGPGLSAISELLELANNANAAITAVGVEDQASLSALRGLGFAAAQGNHLGRVGQINEFVPSRVNDVRKLLELDPLNKTDLAALFRTGAPDVKPTASASADETTKEKVATKANAPTNSSKDADGARDDLVERLAARIAQTTDTGETPAPKPTANPAQKRKKKLTAEERRKAAAIARARKKAAQSASAAQAQNKGVPAHELQDRLSQEFEPTGESSNSASQKTGEPRTAALAESTAADSNGESDQESQTGSAAPDSEFLIDANHEQDKIVADGAATSEDVITSNSEEDSDDEIGVADQAASLTADQTPREAQEFSLAVPGASARFKPGVRVGGPELGLQELPGEVASPDTEEEKDDAGAPPDAQSAAGTKNEDSAEEAQPASWLPTPKPVDAETTDGDEASSEDETREAAWVEESAEIEEAAPSQASRKNLLTRKYQWPGKLWRTFFWPTHFWPKSWTRAWKRRTTAQAERAAERLAEAELPGELDDSETPEPTKNN